MRIVERAARGVTGVRATDAARVRSTRRICERARALVGGGPDLDVAVLLA